MSGGRGGGSRGNSSTAAGCSMTWSNRMAAPVGVLAAPVDVSVIVQRRLSAIGIFDLPVVVQRQVPGCG